MYGDREDVFIAADLLWYPVKGRPDISRAPDVMVVLDHPAGPRSSYKQWEENGRPPNVVFEFITRSNPAEEFLDKLEFYSEMGCDEFFLYDYRRGKLGLFARSKGEGLTQRSAGPEGTFSSLSLGMVLGLDPEGKLWVRRPDGRLMETQLELSRRAKFEAQRAEAEAQRAEAESLRAELEAERAEAEAGRANTEADKAARLAARLRELGVDPDSI